MRILVTGARGKVGAAAARHLVAAGHDVVTNDLGAPVHERDLPDQSPYVQAGLTDAGAVHDLVRRVEAVVHAAAIPDPLHHAPTSCSPTTSKPASTSSRRACGGAPAAW